MRGGGRSLLAAATAAFVACGNRRFLASPRVPRPAEKRGRVAVDVEADAPQHLSSQQQPHQQKKKHLKVMSPPTTMPASTAAALALNGAAQNGVVAAVKVPELPKAVADALALPHVVIKNRERAMRKIAKMIAGGASNLLVISDFDHTLSKAYDEQGVRCWTCHGVMENATLFPHLAQTCKVLAARYMPIEFDGKMKQEEKIPHMEAWWRLSHQAIVDEHVSLQTVTQLVQTANIHLRDNGRTLFDMLEKTGVPLVMFSAGIGDIINIFLQQRLGGVPANAHLISNMMKFDDKGAVTGFNDPLIHTFNKNGSVIQKEASFFHEVRKRDNVILLGDSMGDLHMDVGVENHREEDTLKIGFLNKKDNLLDFYETGYDIVIRDDQTMDVPNAILKAILGL